MSREQRNVLLALDIDQTLAGGVVQAHLRTYNKDLGLGMSEQEIMHANSTYRKTFDVPQIIEYRAKHEDRFQAVRKEVLKSKQVNMDLLPIEGSVDAINLLLSTYAHLGYYTVRPPEMLDVTKEWLSNNRFPSSQETYITKDHADKIRTVSSAGKAMESDPVLIDDSFKDLLEAAVFHNLLNQLRLVAFGMSAQESRTAAASKDSSLSANVHGMEDWSKDSVDELQTYIQRKQK